MRLSLVSDLHGVLPEVPPCDILLIGGDLCPIYNHDEQFQLDWLYGPFAGWLEGLHVPAVGVAGNHDFAAQLPEGDHLLHNLPWTYLQDTSLAIQGLSIWGSPWSNQFGKWAFMMPEEDLNEFIWPLIPPGLDVLITHGPAYNAGDLVKNNWGDAERDPHVGSKSLRQTILNQRPAIHLTGHIHEAYGEYQIGDTRVYNASINNERYDVLDLNPIMVVEL